MSRTITKVLSAGMIAAKVGRNEAQKCVNHCATFGVISFREGLHIMRDVFNEAAKESGRVGLFMGREAKSELKKAARYAKGKVRKPTRKAARKSVRSGSRRKRK